MHPGVLPQRLARDRPHARGEEIKEHEHKGPTRCREAAEHRPEDEGREYFNDGGDDVPAVHEKAEVQRIPPIENEWREEGQGEDAHAGREDRAHVIVRARRRRPAETPLRRRRRCRCRDPARAEEVRLPVDLFLGRLDGLRGRL